MMHRRIMAMLAGAGLLLVLWSLWLPAGSRQLEPRPAPDITERTWLNSKPLQLADLNGQVVLVEFWTYGCYNCRNVEPYIKKWYQRYHAQGLQIVAVHSPEFAHEKKLANVRDYVRKRDIRYPVVLDNEFRIWNAWSNRYWPVIYLVDRQGRLRYRHIGEGAYRQTDRMIRELLAEVVEEQ